MRTKTDTPHTTRSGADGILAARLRLAVARLHRRLRQSAEPGLTISQLSTLASVERHGPITLGDLARIEQVQPPTITVLTGKLETAGLVARTIDGSDRRIHRMNVTAEGARLLAQHRKRKDAFLEARLRRLSVDDRATLARAAEIMESLGREELQ